MKIGSTPVIACMVQRGIPYSLIMLVDALLMMNAGMESCLARGFARRNRCTNLNGRGLPMHK